MSTILSDMRFIHLQSELNHLLIEFRDQSPDDEDLQRAIRLAKKATPETIGAVIHDIQGQLATLIRRNRQEGISLESCLD